MKLKFKHQQFQADAAAAVVEVFAGQPNSSSSYIIDPGLNPNGTSQLELRYKGLNNKPIIVPENIILENIQRIQRHNYIEPSKSIMREKENTAGYNLTIEMETGVGKTYTYIKTMFELFEKYGWSKYIVVVPSIAIREGVYKSFEITADHFAEEYNKKIRYFIYNLHSREKL